MIWQSFVDETILGTSQVAKAAIHGLDGTRYAASTGFVVRYYCIIELLFCWFNVYYSTHYTNRYVNIYRPVEISQNTQGPHLIPPC